jgi:RNA polymerase sigma-70 factor (ECF subfamily)
MLMRAWSPAMMRLARCHVDLSAVAEEVVQETWLAVVTGIGGFEGRSALKTWVLTVCSNLSKRHGVRESRCRLIGIPDGQVGATVDTRRIAAHGQELAGHWTDQGEPAEWGPEARVLTAETRAVLTAAIHGLPERQAHVVALRDLHGLDTAEVAELIGTREGNVRVILHRGRAALRARLADYFAVPAVGR